MNIEFQCSDEALSNKEILEIVNTINIKYNFVQKISVLSPYIKPLKNKINKNICLSSLIDFPLGLLDSETRISLIQKAVDDGAKAVDVVVPSFLINNRNNVKLTKDIEQIYNICLKNGISLSFMLEYRQYNYTCLYRIIKNILNHGINNIYISTGQRIDNIYDHIIAMVMIQKQVPDINIISNANVYNAEHLAVLEKTNYSHFRANNLNILGLIKEKYRIN